MRIVQVFSIGFGAAIAFCSSGAYALWVLEPSAEIRSEYDDNVRLVTTDADKSAIVTEVNVQAELSNVTPRSKFGALVGVNFSDYGSYSGTADLSSEDREFVALSASHEMERSSISLSGNLRRDKLLRSVRLIPEMLGDPVDPADGAVLDDALQPDLEVIDPNDTDVQLIRDQIRRTLISISPSYEVSLNPRTSMRLRYSYAEQSYEEGDQFGLADSVSNRVGLSLRRRMTEIDAATFRANASRFEPDTDLDADIYEATAGWTHSFSQRNQAMVELGVSKVDGDVASDTGFLVRVRGSRRTLRGSMTADLQRSVVPNAYGDLVEADRLSLRIQRRFSQRLELTASGDASQTNSTFGDTNDRKYLQFGTALRWSWTPRISMAGEYRYRWIDRKQDPAQPDSHSFGLSIAYRPLPTTW